MLRTAIVGLGWWGTTLVDAVADMRARITKLGATLDEWESVAYGLAIDQNK